MVVYGSFRDTAPSPSDRHPADRECGVEPGDERCLALLTLAQVVGAGSRPSSISFAVDSDGSVAVSASEQRFAELWARLDEGRDCLHSPGTGRPAGLG
jgi:hypothetical protein